MNELWPARLGVISTQVLQEFAFNLRWKISTPLSAQEASQWIREYTTWEVVINPPGAVLRAVELENTFQISFWDALILQSAERAATPVLYSEEFADGRMYGTVRVVNPLK